jgi:hypothetical protein
MTPLIIMVGADKGGVGKTMVARALDDYLRVKGANQRVFDAEWDAGNLARFAPAAQIVDIENVDHQMRVFDSIKGVTLIDLAARQLSPTLSALSDVGLLDDVRAGNATLALMHVIGSSLASLREISAVADAIGGGVKHILVKNLRDGGFVEWEKDERFAELLKAATSHTITIPRLLDRVATELETTGISFDTFANDREKHGTMLTGYVRNWEKKVWEQFDRVGLRMMIKTATGV